LDVNNGTKDSLQGRGEAKTGNLRLEVSYRS